MRRHHGVHGRFGGFFGGGHNDTVGVIATGAIDGQFVLAG